jgi:capsular polysaccharide biosynthesis protein
MTEQEQPQVALEEVEEFGIFDVLQVIVDNLKLLVLGPLIAGLIALGISFAVRPIFTGMTTFLPPQQQQSAASALLQTIGALGHAQCLETYPNR